MFRIENSYYPGGNPGTDKEVIRNKYIDENGEEFYIVHTESNFLGSGMLFSPYLPLANFTEGKIWYSRPYVP
jgi:hypothetical protein